MPVTVLIAAGGTGGHLFPAEALAHELIGRGAIVHLATDHRATSYGKAFPASETHIIASATFGNRSPVGLLQSGLQLVRGFWQSWRLAKRLKPDVAIGFGGYPTLPPIYGASLAGVPTIIHDSNAVLGRANRALAGRVQAIATTFPVTRGLDAAHAAKTVMTGNPVRPSVIAAVAPYQAPEPEGDFNLLVFGGSQGARVFSELLPPALALLPDHLKRRLKLVQQARAEDAAAFSAAVSALGIRAEVAPFFTDLPARIAAAHLVVCRSGASTVAELAVIGRPSILVPLPHAIDNDQKTNAAILEEAGGGVLSEQKDLTPERLAGLLTDLAGDPARLASMAAAASRQGRADAVSRLADLLLHIASGQPLSNFKRTSLP